MEKVTTYFKEAYDELLNKVTWPSWRELQQSGVIVLAASVIISLLVVAMDLASSWAIKDILYKFTR